MFFEEENDSFSEIFKKINEKTNWYCCCCVLSFLSTVFYSLILLIGYLNNNINYLSSLLITFIFWISKNFLCFVFGINAFNCINKLIKINNEKEPWSFLNEKIIDKSEELKRLLKFALIIRPIPLIPFIFDFLIWRLWYKDYKKLVYEKREKELIKRDVETIIKEKNNIFEYLRRIKTNLWMCCILNTLIIASTIFFGNWWSEEGSKKLSEKIINESTWIIFLFVIYIFAIILSFIGAIDLNDSIEKLSNFDKESVDDPKLIEIIDKSKQTQEEMKWRFLTSRYSASVVLSIIDTFFLFFRFKKLIFKRFWNF